MKGCSGSSINAELKRVANYPPFLLPNASRDRQIIYILQEGLHLRGENRTDGYRRGREYHVLNLRACKQHWQEISGKSVSVPFHQADGRVMRQRTFPIEPFFAPIYIEEKSFMSPPQTMWRGNAQDWATLCHLGEISSNSYALTTTISWNEGCRSWQVRFVTIRQSIHSQSCWSWRDVHTKGLDEGAKRVVSPTEDVPKWEKLTLNEVSRLIGFHDLKMLLSYVVVICDGNFDNMTCAIWSMMWLEECFLSLEFLWGHCIQRLTNYESTYICPTKTVWNVICTKLLQIIAARERWPIYASYSEDAKFCNKSGRVILMQQMATVWSCMIQQIYQWQLPVMQDSSKHCTTHV